MQILAHAVMLYEGSCFFPALQKALFNCWLATQTLAEAPLDEKSSPGVSLLFYG